MREAIVGLDVGTTVAKAVLFDLSGAELHIATAAYRLHTPRPGHVELEPEDVWQAVVEVLRAIAGWAGVETRIRAVALATQGGTLIPCRADGTPTCRAITWMDQRARDLAARWWAEGVGDRVRRISGWSPEPGLPLLSIGWLRQAQPDVFSATEKFLSVNDFVAQRLTGCPGTDLSMAGEMLLTDVTTGQWSDELCHLVGIRTGQLSPILPAGASLGRLRPEICRLTGLSPETVVVNGGQDHACEALALGQTSAGVGLLACGTAWVINGVAASPAIDALPASMNLNYHVLPERWLASQFLGGLGACLEWWLNQCGGHASRTRDESWAAFDAALAETSPGCSGLVYLPQTGVRQVPAPSLGQRHGGLIGLRLDHTWADVGRAILEGAAYELRWALDHLSGTELAIEEMWMVGGAAQSPHWPQIVADVAAVPVLLSQYTHGPALGAAILAAVGLGIFDSVAAARSRFRVSARRIEPEGAHAPVYDRNFAAYQRLARMLAR